MKTIRQHIGISITVTLVAIGWIFCVIMAQLRANLLGSFVLVAGPFGLVYSLIYCATVGFSVFSIISVWRYLIVFDGEIGIWNFWGIKKHKYQEINWISLGDGWIKVHTTDNQSFSFSLHFRGSLQKTSNLEMELQFSELTKSIQNKYIDENINNKIKIPGFLSRVLSTFLVFFGVFFFLFELTLWKGLKDVVVGSIVTVLIPVLFLLGALIGFSSTGFTKSVTLSGDRILLDCVFGKTEILLSEIEIEKTDIEGLQIAMRNGRSISIGGIDSDGMQKVKCYLKKHLTS